MVAVGWPLCRWALREVNAASTKKDNGCYDPEQDNANDAERRPVVMIDLR